MNNAQKIKRLGSTTGNIAVDMVYAAVQHYKNYHRKVKRVNLSTQYWAMFKAYMLRLPDAHKVDIKDEVHFNNLIVRKGSKLMTEHLECELVPVIKD